MCVVETLGEIGPRGRELERLAGVAKVRLSVVGHSPASARAVTYVRTVAPFVRGDQAERGEDTRCGGTSTVRMPSS